MGAIMADPYFNDGLINVTMTQVKDCLNDFLSKQTIKCDCSICLSDIAAIALQELPPLYVNNFLEQDKNKKVNDILVKKQVLKAIRKVQDNPHH